MRFIDKIYIDGCFVTPHGTELFDLYNPATAQVIGRVRLADEEDARTAIAAAKRAFPAFSRTSKADRIAYTPLWTELFDRMIEVAHAGVPPQSMLDGLGDDSRGEEIPMFRTWFLDLWRHNQAHWGPPPENAG